MRALSKVHIEIMKKALGLVIGLSPTTFYGDDFFSVESEGDYLPHIVFEEEGQEEDELSLFEIDENDSSLIPWMSQEISGYMDEIGEIEPFDDVFSYDFFGYRTHYIPSQETIAKRSSKWPRPPKVVYSP